MRPAVPGEVLADPFGAVRRACAEVAARARHVRLDEEKLEAYEVSAAEVQALEGPRLPQADEVETRCAFVLALDAINFGSGWFPQLEKRPGHSGYRTIEAGLIDRFDGSGPLWPGELRSMSGERCAALLGQSAPGPEILELMELFARAWRDLGSAVDETGGSFETYVRGAGGTAQDLVRRLLGMPLFRDLARYDGLTVPFLKRAQLAVADLSLAAPALPPFPDLDELTLFADNLVPHVLHRDGLLRYPPALEARIQRGELLAAGSAEEVEIRAVAVHAVERLSARTGLSARALDYWLWNRGGLPAYKAWPRHRCRCPYY